MATPNGNDGQQYRPVAVDKLTGQVFCPRAYLIVGDPPHWRADDPDADANLSAFLAQGRGWR